MPPLFQKRDTDVTKNQISIEERILEQFFTNSHEAIEAFEYLAPTVHSSKRILVVYGVGGVGKSTLLKMYRLSCCRHNIPAALADSEEIRTPIEILASWEEDLRNNGIKLSSFQDALAHYKALQTKVETEASKHQKTITQVTGKLSKVAIKTAVEMAASTIPVIGPLVGGVTGEGAEALIDWLHGFLSKPDLDLYLDPSVELAASFLSDLSKIASHRRIVLMLDTYEQITLFDTWLREFARQLSPDVLLVIAGREVPNWERTWCGWLSLAEVIPLRQMNSDDIRKLIYRYNKTIRGCEPDSEQIEEIVQFARGFPLVATTTVQLWVKYGIADFQVVRPQVVDDLVDRFLEGVPEESHSIFEAAAIVRFFNVETLQAILDNPSCDAQYMELRRWPFILPRREGLSMHDTMREMINENLHTRAPQRYKVLHNRALQYYQTLVDTTQGDDRDRYSLEVIYHAICVDESNGVQLFQRLAEELVSHHLVCFLRALLKDANNYPLIQENSILWREYYYARLVHLEERPADELKIYEQIINNKQAEAKLRAYSFCDLGFVLTRGEFLEKPKGIEKAIQVLTKALDLGFRDTHVNHVYLWLYRISIHTGNWDQGIRYLSKAEYYFKEHGDNYGLINAYLHASYLFTLRGMWYETFTSWNRAIVILKGFTPKSQLPKAMILSHGIWPFALAGRLHESEQMAKEDLAILRELKDDLKTLIALRDLGYAVGSQDRCEEAEQYFNESITLTKQLGNLYQIDMAAGLGFLGVIVGRHGDFQRAKQYLMQSLEIKESVNDIPAMQETLVWLGQVAEMQSEWNEARSYYQRCIDWGWYGNHYFDCGAATGLTRVMAVLGDYDAVMKYFKLAEELANTYEYNDHLAALKQLQAQVSWEGKLIQWGKGFKDAQVYFQLALVYSLRYNRFLLDELIGNSIASPIRKLVVICQDHNDEGQQMLSVQKEFWQNNTNDTGISRAKTISRIPERMNLLQAERLARKLEPGDGAKQRSVTEQIDWTLANFTH